MLKKILLTFMMCAFVCSAATVVLAAGEAPMVGYDGDNNTTEDINTWNGVVSFLNGGNSGNSKKRKVVLNEDIDISAMTLDEVKKVHFKASGGILDLNGHTITVRDNENDPTLFNVGISGGLTIENGSIVFDCKKSTAGLMPYAYAMVLDNVEIATSENCKLFASVVCLSSNVQLNNCVIDTDIAKNSSVFMLGGEGDTPQGVSIKIKSGSISNFSLADMKYDPVKDHGITFAEGSQVVTLDGVSGMVIASPQTQAIVVKDGKAYTYDSFEEAKADAAVADGAELLQHKGDFVFGIPVIWASDTDAGYYMDAQTKYGVIRFLFDSGVDASKITGSGIKFAKSSDITQAVNASVGGGDNNSRAFYGDITQIPADDSSTYYAVAYVTTTDGTEWSEVVECKPNFNKLINYEGGNE